MCRTITRLALTFCFFASAALAQNSGGLPIGPGGGGGGGGSGGSGVSSLATSCPGGVAINPSTGAVVIGLQTVTRTATDPPASPVNVNTDCGSIIYLNSAIDRSPVLADPSGTGFPAGWATLLCNINAAQTLTPAAGTIGGAATKVVGAGTASSPVCLGTISNGVNNYQLESFASPVVITAGSTATSGITSGDLVSSTSNLIADSGILAANVATTATFAAPPAIGNTTPAAGSFTTLSGTTSTATPKIGPVADSTTAFQITKADLATRIMDFDTTNARVGINKTPGAFDLDVNGAVNFASTLGVTSNATIGGNLFLSSNGSLLELRNGNTVISSPATAVWQFGSVDAAAPVAQTIRSQGSRAATDTNVGGANLTVFSGTGTGTGTPSTLTFQTPAVVGSGTGAQTQTTGIVIGGATAGAVLMPNLAASSAAQTGTVCWTTGGGNLTVDTTAACLVSLEEYKDIHGPIVGALDEVMALKPFWYSWKDDDHKAIDPHDQPGLGAHQVESVDARIAAYSPDGTLRGVRYQQLTAVLVAAMQEQQSKIDALEKRLAALEHPTREAVIKCEGSHDSLGFWHDPLPFPDCPFPPSVDYPVFPIKKGKGY